MGEESLGLAGLSGGVGEISGGNAALEKLGKDWRFLQVGLENFQGRALRLLGFILAQIISGVSSGGALLLYWDLGI